MNKSTDKAPLKFLIYYAIVSTTVGILVSTKSGNNTFFKQLLEINLLELILNFSLVFTLSLFVCLVVSTPYFMTTKKVKAKTLNELDKLGLTKITSVISLLFAMMNTLTIEQFEQILDIVAFIPLFTISVKIFMEISKQKLTKN
ncbi:hypothetical protein [Ezakiella peruensis]|uniref:hypothetical protein n=1 Tax=Ezakiella peruensis TaxID=1464038 RepID=UPI000C1B23D7|nr:hypothetical protein [Ezakiella peruensis]